MILPNQYELVTALTLLRFTARRLFTLFLFDMGVALAYVYLGWTWVSLPHIPLTIFGGVIGLIIGFRNTSSYQRWWEARTLWGAVVNYSRTMARQCLTLITAPAGSEESEANQVRRLQEELVHLQIGYVHALRCHLRGQPPWSDLEKAAPEFDGKSLHGHRNVPVAIQQRMGELVREAYERGWLDSIRWQAIDASLTALANAQGGAERIKNTPMPRQYDFFPRLFVTVYCILLPLGLVGNLQLLTPIGSTLAGFIFLALDEIGRDLESPFDNTQHDVPITSISTTIEINLRQLLGETELPEPVKAVRGVLW